MLQLAEHKRFQVDPETFKAVRTHLTGDFVTNDESLATIKRVWDESGYLMDPHTAVAWEVAERTRAENPVLVVSTAHWAKFGSDVLKALHGLAYSASLPAEYDGLTGVELLAQVQRVASDGACAPRALAELDTAEVRFSDVVDSGRDGVEAAVRRWLG
jgi:threonine synthase